MNLTKETYFLFSGGEVHTQRQGEASTIVMRDYTMNGFMALAEIAEIYRARDLVMPYVVYPYLPYARQDRIIRVDEPFSLRTFARLLNSLESPRVVVFDPHSDVTAALVNNCKVMEQHKIALQVIPVTLRDDPDVLFVSPDAGALKKIAKLIPDTKRTLTGVKQRNADGQITGTQVYGDADPKGRICVIVDDICDGGTTFINLAEVLLAKGAKEVHLYVTHGIFSRGMEALTGYISHIYTTDSFEQIPHPSKHVAHINWGHDVNY